MQSVPQPSLDSPEGRQRPFTGCCGHRANQQNLHEIKNLFELFAGCMTHVSVSPGGVMERWIVSFVPECLHLDLKLEKVYFRALL
jgi:hypothetical protein